MSRSKDVLSALRRVGAPDGRLQFCRSSNLLWLAAESIKNGYEVDVWTIPLINDELNVVVSFSGRKEQVLGYWYAQNVWNAEVDAIMVQEAVGRAAKTAYEKQKAAASERTWNALLAAFSFSLIFAVGVPTQNLFAGFGVAFIVAVAGLLAIKDLVPRHIKGTLANDKFARELDELIRTARTIYAN